MRGTAAVVSTFVGLSTITWEHHEWPWTRVDHSREFRVMTIYPSVKSSAPRLVALLARVTQVLTTCGNGFRRKSEMRKRRSIILARATMQVTRAASPHPIH